MTEVKHTPLPFYAEKYSSLTNAGYKVAHKDDKGFIKWICHSSKEEDAAFIIRACNSHYDLVAFVERFVKDMNNTEAHNCDVVTEARALIAKAKGAA